MYVMDTTVLVKAKNKLKNVPLIISDSVQTIPTGFSFRTQTNRTFNISFDKAIEYSAEQINNIIIDWGSRTR